MNPPLYTLYHVNRLTGEKVRYPRHSFPATDKATAEQAAQGSRTSQAMVPSRAAGADEWVTEAHPDTAE